MRHHFLTDRRGNFAVTGALIAIPLLVGTAMAVDYARLEAMRTNAQDAIDAAALAGLRVDGTFDKKLARKVFKVNMMLRAGQETEDPVFSSLGGSDWKGSVSGTMKLTFGNLIMPETVKVTAVTAVGFTAATGPTFPSSATSVQPGCIYVLDDSWTAFNQNSNATINAPHCTINVGSKIDSSIGKAGLNAGFNLDVAEICIGGTTSYDNRTITEKARATPVISRQCAVPGDIYRDMIDDIVTLSGFTSVRDGACRMGTGWTSVDAASVPAATINHPGGLYNAGDKVYTMEPGRYCGGINFNSGSYKIFLKPGLYVVDAGWNVNGMDIVGEDVSIHYGPGGNIQMNADTGPVLTAPSGGTFKGLLLWEDPNKTTSQPFVVNSNKSYSTLTGVIYLPNRATTLNTGAKATYRASMVYKTLIINAGTYINFDDVPAAQIPDHDDFDLGGSGTVAMTKKPAIKPVPAT